MDPNALLAEIRHLVLIVGHSHRENTLPHQLAMKIDELDTWITKGGFLPRPSASYDILTWTMLLVYCSQQR